MEEITPSFWGIPLEELAKLIGQNLGLTQKEAEAVFQARITLEGARRVAEEGRKTTIATWALAIATWVLVLADVTLRVLLGR